MNLGWRFCEFTRGHCSVCKTLVTGVWLYFVSAANSTTCVCAACAEDL